MPSLMPCVAKVYSPGEQFMARMTQLFDSIQLGLGDFLWNLVLVLVVLLLVRLSLLGVSIITKRVMREERYHRDESQGRRIDTLMTLIRSVARYIIYFVAVLYILGLFGLSQPLNGLIAAAGVGSLAIGFGAQNLVKDVVTGLFMIFENQFSVGDYVQIDSCIGSVEATAMRVTYLRTLQGEQIIIPNGTISRVTNFTRGNSVAQVIISTAYEADTRQILEIITQAVAAYAEENPHLVLETPTVLGIIDFAPSSIDIGIRCKTPAMSHRQVERGLRLIIKETFERQGVAFPYPHMTVECHNSNPSI